MSLFQHIIYKISLISLCSAITVGPVVSAELYKWVDKNGVTQYSEKPPADRSGVQTLNVPVTPPDQAAIDKLKTRVETVDKLRETRVEDQKLKRQVEQDIAVNEENCRRAKAKSAAYQVPNALIAQPDGSRIRVDEPTRLKELAASKEMIGKYCTAVK